MTISGTKEWAVAEINCCIGCPHDCRYCYARLAALRTGAIADAGQWRKSRVVGEMVEARHPKYGGQVMFPTAHDIIDDNLEASVKVIGNLLAAGNRVLVVSKPSVSCIERICNSFEQDRGRILFRFTITARDEDMLSFWEPGAPAYRERLHALELASTRGYETSVSIEPLLDAPDIGGLVADVSPFVSHSIWIGKMNKIAQRVEIDNEQTEAEVRRIEEEQIDSRIVALYQSLKDHPLIRWKESIKKVVGIELLTESGLDV